MEEKEKDETGKEEGERKECEGHLSINSTMLPSMRVGKRALRCSDVRIQCE